MDCCINHPERPSEWHCRDCGRNLCPDCVDTIVVQHQTAPICRACRGKCERLDLLVRAHLDFKPSFYAGAARRLVSIYSWAVALHIIGRLYHCNRSKLRWVA